MMNDYQNAQAYASAGPNEDAVFSGKGYAGGLCASLAETKPDPVLSRAADRMADLYKQAEELRAMVGATADRLVAEQALATDGSAGAPASPGVVGQIEGGQRDLARVLGEARRQMIRIQNLVA